MMTRKFEAGTRGTRVQCTVTDSKWHPWAARSVTQCQWARHTNRRKRPQMYWDRASDRLGVRPGLRKCDWQ